MLLASPESRWGQSKWSWKCSEDLQTCQNWFAGCINGLQIAIWSYMIPPFPGYHSEMERKIIWGARKLIRQQKVLIWRRVILGMGSCLSQMGSYSSCKFFSFFCIGQNSILSDENALPKFGQKGKLSGRRVNIVNEKPWTFLNDKSHQSRQKKGWNFKIRDSCYRNLGSAVKWVYVYVYVDTCGV